MWKRLSRTSRWLVGAVGFFGSVIAIAQVIGPVRRWTGHHASALYPVGWMIVEGVVIAIAVGGAAALALLWRRAAAGASDLGGKLAATVDELATARSDLAAARAELAGVETRAEPERREHDRRIVAEIRDLIPRSVADFLKEHDMGGAWREEMSRPIHFYAADYGGVEHSFLDPELEGLRRALLRDAAVLSRMFAMYGGPQPGNSGWYDIGPTPDYPGAPGEERWDQRRQELNDAADRVASAYDALLARAHAVLVGLD